MCLRNKLTNKEQKKILDKIDRKGIKVYKVVVEALKGEHPQSQRRWEGYKSPYTNVGMTIYEDGINVAKQQKINTLADYNETYTSGFHFYKSKSAAEKTAYRFNLRLENLSKSNFGLILGHQYTVVECIVKKSWITTIGEEQVTN